MSDIPQTTAVRPKVHLWFLIYGWLSVALLAAILISYFVESRNRPSMGMLGTVIVVMMICVLLAWAFPVVVVQMGVRARWVWILGIILLGVGVASLCLPLALPLLIFWVRRDNQAFHASS